MKIVFYLLLALLTAIPSIWTANDFHIDYETNQFIKDGKPFRYISGSIHYFRVPSALWRDRMLSFKAAGLNAIQTYVDWSFHEPEKGVFDFSGDKDLIAFFQLAHEMGFVVILRPGPFIASSRDLGGLPYWLLTINPNMKLRTFDKQYIKEVDDWNNVLMPKLVPMLYKNGGPVIMFQVENEYGSYGCDFQYTAYLRDKFIEHLGHDVVLFTTDGNADSLLKCGKIDNVLATVDFGAGENVTESFATQRRHQEFGPNVNSEYYPGRFDTWELPHVTAETKSVCHTLDQILAYNASVNIYMFIGGTSFGFSGGPVVRSDKFWPATTSFDYDAPLSEAGDPTPKYFAMRQIIGKYVPLPNMTLPVVKPKMEIPQFPMKFVSSLYDQVQLKEAIHAVYPLTFEQLKQNQGYILYSTNITIRPSDPAILNIPGLADRAHIFVDSEYRVTMSRVRQTYQVPINIKIGSKLDILVESQGRGCFSPTVPQIKGIISNVTLGPVVLKNWNHYKIFDDWEEEVKQIKQSFTLDIQKSYKPSIPSFFVGQFTLSNVEGYPLDTFLRLDGWTKGVAFLNGFNLGRYWMVGPQITLYSPSHLFKPYPQTNTLVVYETEVAPCLDPSKCLAHFTKIHEINATVPIH